MNRTRQTLLVGSMFVAIVGSPNPGKGEEDIRDRVSRMSHATPVEDIQKLMNRHLQEQRREREARKRVQVEQQRKRRKLVPLSCFAVGTCFALLHSKRGNRPHRPGG